MQSNDLNVLTSQWSIEDLKNRNSAIKNIYYSSLPRSGKCVTAKEIENAAKVKIPVPEEVLIQVRKTVAKYEQLGKSRRWIRRYIKRKFNIVEY